MSSMAQHGVQGRGVMINLRKHYGFERHAVSYDDLMRILERDGISVEKGDIVCLYTGYADKLIELGEDVIRSCRRPIVLRSMEKIPSS